MVEEITLEKTQRLPATDTALPERCFLRGIRESEIRHLGDAWLLQAFVGLETPYLDVPGS